MKQFRQQRTLAAPARVAGFGYWSGLDVRVEFHPAPADTGIVFVRTDLPQRPRIPADSRNCAGAPRRTNLSHAGAQVSMVEHVMAALAGLQIDNCEVRVDSAEMPGLDGSSLPFVEMLQQAGFAEQSAPRHRLRVSRPLRVGDDNAWLSAEPYDGFHVRYELDFGGGPIGRQVYEVEVEPEVFVAQVAPARTFILDSEAEWLRQQGLGLRVTRRDLLVFDEHGPQDNTLRFEDECARHKTLDLIGDLALAGRDLAGCFTACRSGHRLNAQLVATLLAAQPIQERRHTA